jgi:hypothetical protein
MRDLAYFSAGLAWSSLFPRAIHAALEGNPGYFVLGAAAVLLPDALDSAFGRFRFRHDVEVVPDPADPDPSGVAKAIALSANSAVSAGRPVAVRLHPVRMGWNTWRHYTLSFNVPARTVEVAFGPICDDRGRPATGEQPAAAVARRSFDPAIHLEDTAAFSVNGRVDVVMLMTPRVDGSFSVALTPQRQRLSHSLVSAGILGLALAAAAGPLAAFVGGGAFAIHLLVDRCAGEMSDLLAPFRRPPARPAHGRPASETPALVLGWLFVLVLFVNLLLASGVPCRPLHVFRCGALVAVIPLAAALFLRRLPEGQEHL